MKRGIYTKEFKKAKRKYIRKNKPAPNHKAYCPVCEKETVFIYNRHIHHSYCSDCGARKFKKKHYDFFRGD